VGSGGSQLDQDLRIAEREYLKNPTSRYGRKLYRLMMQHGQHAEAIQLRADLGYADEIAVLPRPTKEQCDSFAIHVSEAHSWYKHLRAEPTPFYFYLAPYIGWIEDQDGNIREMVKEDCWHYSSVPTKEYRERFGYWGYWVGESFFQDNEVITESRKLIKVPKEFGFSAPITCEVHRGNQEQIDDMYYTMRQFLEHLDKETA